MRVLHFIKVSFLLNGVLGATIKTPDSGENTDVNSIMAYESGTTLPPPEIPCKQTCSCTEGAQPPTGRVYCGYCWGIDAINGNTMYGSEVIRCSPGACCSYGYYDGRCDTNSTQPDYKLFCPDGMKKRSVALTIEDDVDADIDDMLNPN